MKHLPILKRIFLVLLMFCIVFETAHSGEGACSLKIAIFREQLPGVNSRVSEELKKHLELENFKTDLVSGAELADPGKFNRLSFDLLLIPESQTFPLDTFKNIDQFLRKGGHIFTLNGPPFSNPCIRKENGEFIDQHSLEKLRKTITEKKMLIDFETKPDLSKWIRDVDPECTPSRFDVEPGGANNTKQCLRTSYTDFKTWDTIGMPFENPFPPGYSLTCFWAKGAPQTNMLSVEWEEKDHSRWIASIMIKPEWNYYMLSPADFKYWHTSATGKSRGFSGDLFQSQNAALFRVGLARSHTYLPPGKHEFCIDEVNVAPDLPGLSKKALKPPVLETISPPYKFYPLTNIKSIVCSPLLGDLNPESLKPKTGFSPTLRPQGTGYLKNRKARFIPIIKAYDTYGLWSGTLASLLVNTGGEYNNSVFANVTFDSSKDYLESDLQLLIEKMCRIINGGLFLTEGGTEFFAYFHDDRVVKIGAEVLNLCSNAEEVQVQFKILTQNEKKCVFEHTGKITIPPGGKKSLETSWKPSSFEKDVYLVTTQLIKNEKTIDALEHQLLVWFPSKKKDFITVKNGHFYLPGEKEPWFPFGVNYMPSSGIALEEQEWFEHWLDSHTYDPEIIETDLSRIEKILNMNMISIFLYSGRKYSGNLLDILCRAKKHKLRVHHSLRPYANLLWFKPETVKEIIDQYRLDQNDTIFAYDIAWEPWLGKYQKRKQWDSEWRNWIEIQYGSIPEAEKDWKHPAQRDKGGNVTAPSDRQLLKDGEWRVMVAAYRRFVDDFLCKKYTVAIRKIKQFDPNHLVSFRMSEAGNPKCLQHGFPYDVRAIAKPVEFFEPEGYGRFSDVWDNTKTGIFTAFYLRSLAEKPVFWGEFGQSVWREDNFDKGNMLLDIEKKGYHNFYRMILESRSDGGSAWWFAGGFRWNEDSDFGMLNPDGSTRPLIEAVDKYKPLLTKPPWIKNQLIFKPDVWITVDRDKHTDGIYGIYKEIEQEFWNAWKKGKTIGFKTKGTGSTSVDTPLIAVGNVKFTGHNPPKYLNSQFNFVQVKNRLGKWEETENHGTVTVQKGKPVSLKISIGNTGDAAWISPLGKNENNKGTVFLGTPDDSDIIAFVPVPKDTPFFKDVLVEQIIGQQGITKSMTLVLRMHAKDRAWFGERFEIKLMPKQKE